MGFQFRFVSKVRCPHSSNHRQSSGKIIMKGIGAAVLLFLAMYCGLSSAIKKGECEVCVKVIERFSNSLSAEEKSAPAKIEAKFREFCKDLKSKENRFCYFIGGTADAATGILGEMSKPLSWGMPPTQVCEKL